MIISYVLNVVNCSTTLNKPVLRFPQEKLNSSSFFSVYQTQNKKVEVIIGWQVRPRRPREAAASHMETGVLICPASLHQLLICRQHAQAGQEQGGNVGCLLAQPLTSQKQGQALHHHGRQSAPRSPQVQASCGMQMTQRPKGSQVTVLRCGPTTDDNSCPRGVVSRLFPRHIEVFFFYFFLNALSLD